MSASLENHDGPTGNINNQGIWAKIYNIQSKIWLTNEPFNVNQVSEGGQTESATVALTGLKFLIAFYTDSGYIKTRMWTPSSSSDVTTNTWTAGNEESVNSIIVYARGYLRWLKMPKESKVLLTWNHYDTSEKINKIWGQFYHENTGSKIGPAKILLTR